MSAASLVPNKNTHARLEGQPDNERKAERVWDWQTVRSSTKALGGVTSKLQKKQDSVGRKFQEGILIIYLLGYERPERRPETLRFFRAAVSESMANKLHATDMIAFSPTCRC